MEATELLGRINANIVNPTITFLFAVATVVFIWGLVQFLLNTDSDSERTLGKRKIVYGLLGMFIMVAVLGIIRVILSTFGIPTDLYIFG
ncbi:MAG: hypothetical protein MRY49_01665 [Candidatus Pacebacteria bacterium]|nr:hypothetical protein [Candidatus Paceibacterota bacterium]